MYQKFTNSLKGLALASFLTVMCCSLVATSFAQTQKSGQSFAGNGIYTALAGVSAANMQVGEEPCDVENAGTITVGDWNCTDATPTVLLAGTAALPMGGGYEWQFSNDNGASWTMISGATTQSLLVSETGMYKRGYKAAVDQGCDYEYTTPVTITNPNDVTLSPITFETHDGESSVTICKGNQFNCNFSTSEEASHVVWQASSDNGANWSDMEASYRVYNKMLFRYEYTISPTCKIASDAFFVNVYNGPTFNRVENPTDLCARTSYELKAIFEEGDAPIENYVWGGAATGNTEIGTVTTTEAECSKTYDYAVTAVDENGCVSGYGGSFTTNDGIFSLVDVEDQAAVRGTDACEYLIPDLVTLVSDMVVSDCPVTVTQTPAANTTIEVGTETMVAVKVENTCGVSTTVNVKVVAPAAPTVTLVSDAERNKTCHGEAVNFTATAMVSEWPEITLESYTWSEGVTVDADDNSKAVREATTEASALTIVRDTYTVSILTSDGCTANASVEITTLPKADRIANKEDETCMPAGYEYAPTNVPENTTYTWTVKSNTDETNNAAAQATAQNSFNISSLTNNTLAYQTVVYEVTPVTSTVDSGLTYTCVGEMFDVTLTVKPSITTEGAITDFTNPDVEITLWYGACDTAYYVQEPTYVNHIAEYDGLIVLSNDKSTANEGAILGRMTPGTYTIVWRLTDPCGNFVDYPQKFIVSYPVCGTGLTATDVDGNEYETVRIGCECWTKSNLRTTGATFANVYTAAEVPAVDEATFGLLYTWYSAMGVAENDNNAVPTVLTANGSGYPYVQGICPEGWAVPSAATYQQIAADANALKSTEANAWLPGSTATNATGFSAVGAGYYDASSDRYINMLGETYFWSAETTSVVNGTCSALTQTCPQAIVKDQVKGQGFSVRCIKRDNE